MVRIEICTDDGSIKILIRDDNEEIERVTVYSGKRGLHNFETQQQAEIFAEGIALGLRLARERMANELKSEFSGMSNGMNETIYT